MSSNPSPNDIVIALAGNPNAGKTTLFNSLTGLRQKVANYPGVTVERKEGNWKLPFGHARLIDLPGLYSLEATSLDEQIARQVIAGELKDIPRPSAVIAVVDSTNLERNLYLVTQILEFGIPVVVALTMMDVFEKQGHEIDIALLSKRLGVPVIAVNAKDGRGVEDLAKAASDAVGKPAASFKLEAAEDGDSQNARIFARYNFVSDVVQAAVRHNDLEKHRRSEKIDSVLTHRFFGLAILAGLMLLVFQAIFSWASLPMDLLEQGFGWLADESRAVIPAGILNDLVSDGIIAGVGGVVVFLPQILLLFFFISLLEDSGYMARAAFLLDKLMSRVGLHGKAFLPLISSFACAIPGIMATRTIESRRDRFATIMIAPLMSCSARLPVYTLMIGAFFSGQYLFGFLSLGAVLMLLMYLLGIVTAIIVAFILKRTILNAPPPPFLMELPPYRMPNIRTVVQNMLTRAWLFLKRAGTVILAISIVLWALTYFPRHEQSAPAVAAAGSELNAGDAKESPEDDAEAGAEQIRNSYAGRLGHLIEPVIEPLGFDWKIGVALIASFAAREVLVSTLSIIYSVGKEENEESQTLIAAIRSAKRDDGRPVWTPLTALTLMVFFVLAMQCMSTVAVVRRETNSWSWPLFMIVYMTGLAYLVSFATYQIGRALGFE
ncbi:MAG: ferrous iron transport protein B [Acidobacteria bacterium]|nr:ferrous iron transport protein B [Acidobacteriota bacterium]